MSDRQTYPATTVKDCTPKPFDHPMQPIILVDEVPRFKANKAVRWMVDNMCDLNVLSMVEGIPDEDMAQLMQLLGYSVSAFGGLSFVDSCLTHRADMAAAALLNPPDPFLPPEKPRTLEEDIARAINCHSGENGSNTPDFILAEFLMRCLQAFDVGVRKRAAWGTPFGTPSAAFVPISDYGEVLTRNEQFLPSLAEATQVHHPVVDDDGRCADTKIHRGPPIADIRGAVARGWCHPDNGAKEMDSELALAIAAEVQRLFDRQLLAVDAWIAQAEDALRATLPEEVRSMGPALLQEYRTATDKLPEAFHGTVFTVQRQVIDALLALTPAD